MSKTGKGETKEKTNKQFDLGALEEDDDFEEFPAEDWKDLSEQCDTNPWENEWDDDESEDDFSKQLRAELEKHSTSKK